MKAKLLHIVYSLLITLALPLAVLRLLWKSRKNPDYRRRLSERFALNLPHSQNAIWIHTVSVGEFLATLPLIQQLLDEDYPLLITTTTPTGSAMLKQRLGEQVSHCYLPFDAPFLTHLFVKRTQPRVAVFVETEIWANYLKTLKKNNTPALLINARLSEKSFNGYAKLGQFAHQTLTCFTEVACQNKASQQRFQQLGAKASTLGNMKFDLTAPIDLLQRQTQLRQLLGDKPFILAASTHSDEEAIIWQAFQQSRYAKTHRLIIAPRHPERSREIINHCQTKDHRTVAYSQIAANLSADTQTLIIDSLGELLYFYSLAEFAIIGGSLVPHGGHNPLEAALFATPCLIGEHYFNFDSLVREMKNENAIVLTTAEQLFNPPSDLAAVGKNAQRFLAKNQGALEQYTQLIKYMVT